jgi:hypothetical protein
LYGKQPAAAAAAKNFICEREVNPIEARGFSRLILFFAKMNAGFRRQNKGF